MNAKHEKGPLGEHYFYCFVDFQEPKKVRPIVYIMPAAVVAKVLTESHRKWLNTLGLKGQPHKDNPQRVLLPDYSKIWASENPYPAGWMESYRDAWGILNLEKIDPEKPLPTD
jgi:hypothetical protein